MEPVRCECTTSKKAWRNPHAPMASCKNEAKYEFTTRLGKKIKACGTHAKKEQKWNKDVVLTPIQTQTS